MQKSRHIKSLHEKRNDLNCNAMYDGMKSKQNKTVQEEIKDYECTEMNPSKRVHEKIKDVKCRKKCNLRRVPMIFEQSIKFTWLWI